MIVLYNSESISMVVIVDKLVYGQQRILPLIVAMTVYQHTVVIHAVHVYLNCALIQQWRLRFQAQHRGNHARGQQMPTHRFVAELREC